MNKTLLLPCDHMDCKNEISETDLLSFAFSVEIKHKHWVDSWYVTKHYRECLNLKSDYSKRHIVVNPPQNSLTSNTLRIKHRHNKNTVTAAAKCHQTERQACENITTLFTKSGTVWLLDLCQR